MNPAPQRFARAILAGAGVFMCLALVPTVARAQAWLPQKGSFSYSIDYTNTLSKYHYTRTGDDGSTGLFGGGRIRKSDPRIECYGTIDELNAAIGLA